MIQKEKLEEAKMLYKDANADQRYVLERLFPELANIEDEKIRGAIIDHLKDNNLTEWAAWLEKQGEQKPVDKVEPKFKVGDYVVDNCGYVWKVEGIINQFYILEGIDGGESRPTIDWVNKTFHLWTIEDAKDGDVLQLCNVTVIFQEYIGNGNCKCYCSVYNGEFEIPSQDGEDNSYGCHIATPATKEQRDTLMKAMTEAGYEWDAKKKELKKIEDEDYEKYDGEDYGIDSLWHAKNILEETLGKVDGYQTDDGILEHKCAISAVYRLYNQKPAEWSEDDERISQSIIADIKSRLNNCTHTMNDHYYNEQLDWLNNWLKSLKRIST